MASRAPAETTTTTTHPPQWALVDKYVVGCLQATSAPEEPGVEPEQPSKELMDIVTENCRKKGLPDIAVSASQGKFLQLLARAVNARSILEIGTLGGFSTIFLANAMPDTRVATLEMDRGHARVALENLNLAGLHLPGPTSTQYPPFSRYKHGAEVHVGAALDTLPPLQLEVRTTRAPFDFVFIDADKENNWRYVDAAAAMCRPGALIVVDNVVREGRVADPTAEDTRVQGARRVIENVGKDKKRFSGAVMQMVGEKGYDGFLLIYVKEGATK